jgi:hypothetical protein
MKPRKTASQEAVFLWAMRVVCGLPTVKFLRPNRPVVGIKYALSAIDSGALALPLEMCTQVDQRDLRCIAISHCADPIRPKEKSLHGSFLIG